ncbi:MAG: hypothetical protein WCS32_04385 [Candidatus Izemoplasmatales bacterium]
MTWVLISLPLITIFVYTYLRMLSKSNLKGEIFYHTFFQTSISFLLVILFFFQGFIEKFYVIVIIVALLLLISLFYFLKDNDLSFTISGVLKLEAIKNNILFVGITILSLYVSLTIFRYMDWYFQILFSVVTVITLIILSQILRKKLEFFYQDVKNWITESGISKYLVLWGVFGFVLFAGLFIQIPTNNIKQFLNLNNNSKYFVFQGLPNDIKNNYEQELLFSMNITSSSSGKNIEDFYIENNTVYFSYGNTIEKYDMEKGALIGKYYLEMAIDYEEKEIFKNRFIEYENSLYYYDSSGFYKLIDSEVDKISDYSTANSKIFYNEEGRLSFLTRKSDILYDIHYLLNGSIVFEKTVDISLLGYEDLVVISDSLFYKENNDYILFVDTNYTFKNVSSERAYNSNLKKMYYFSDFEVFVDDGINQKKILRYLGYDISNTGFVGDMLIFRTELNLEKARLIMYNDDYESLYLFNHLDTDTFLIDKDYKSGYIVNYREYNDDLSFVQVETRNNGEERLIQVFELVEKPTDLILPIYSHFGLYILLVILVCVFVPITDDIKYVTYLGNENFGKKKN